MSHKTMGEFIVGLIAVALAWAACCMLLGLVGHASWWLAKIGWGILP